MDIEIKENTLENKIDYRRIIEALDYYEKIGYKYIDVDWAVDPSVSAQTKPTDHKDFFINDKVLVASAEQSFIQKIVDSNLQKGRYCAITPCFRDDVKDSMHSNYFMKLELIETEIVNTVMLHSMGVDAFNFYKKYVPCRIMKIDDTHIDIVTQDNEYKLGSYGIRNIDNFSYIYGTGLAEPRLGKVIELCK